MTLITILASLLIERYVHWLEDYRQVNWVNNYINWACEKLENLKWADGSATLILLITPILLIIVIIDSLLNDIHSVYSIVFGIFILSYCIGPRKIYLQAKGFINARKQGDKEGAILHLGDLLGDDIPSNESLLILNLNKEILIQTSRKLLSVFFWFAILGPIGAVLVRLACQIQEEKTRNGEDCEFTQAAIRLQYILNWIPSRLVALSYAVSGSFVHAQECWRHTREDDTSADKNNDILTCIGLSALQASTDTQQEKQETLNTDSVNETLKLCTRSIIVWVTIIAAMTLAGWMH